MVFRPVLPLTSETIFQCKVYLSVPSISPVSLTPPIFFYVKGSMLYEQHTALKRIVNASASFEVMVFPENDRAAFWLYALIIRTHLSDC